MGFMRERSGGSFLGFILVEVLRLLQLVFALTVIGLYGQDLHRAAREKKYSDSKWAYAVVCGSLGAVTALIYGLIPLFMSSLKVAIFAIWDVILFILWIALFGLFGSMYIHEHDTAFDSGVQRMKNAVWIDLINALLWLLSAVMGAIGFWKWMKGGRSLHTGRAQV